MLIVFQGNARTKRLQWWILNQSLQYGHLQHATRSRYVTTTVLCKHRSNVITGTSQTYNVKVDRKMWQPLRHRCGSWQSSTNQPLLLSYFGAWSVKVCNMFNTCGTSTKNKWCSSIVQPRYSEVLSDAKIAPLCQIFIIDVGLLDCNKSETFSNYFTIFSSLHSRSLYHNLTIPVPCWILEAWKLSAVTMKN